ncbi:MAG: FHA domain-containing protein [Nannocystaceae bacterium]
MPGLGVGSGAGQQHTAQPPALADGSRTEFVAPPEDSEGSSTEFVHGPEPHDATEYMAQPDWAESSSRTQITEAPPPEVVAELPRDAALRGHGPAGKVTVLSGSLNGASYALAAKVSLGRSPDCTITLPDGTVSAIHAVVIRWRRRSMLLDWDSKSGTTLNGQRVVRAFLKNGDRIGVGGVSLQFHAASDGRRLGVWVLSGLGVVSGLAYLARGFFGT